MPAAHGRRSGDQRGSSVELGPRRAVHNSAGCPQICFQRPEPSVAFGSVEFGGPRRVVHIGFGYPQKCLRATELSVSAGSVEIGGTPAAGNDKSDKAAR
jgi:hypothetical protein